MFFKIRLVVNGSFQISFPCGTNKANVVLLSAVGLQSWVECKWICVSWLWQMLQNILQAYVHPTTGKKLGGPGAESGPVEIDDAAYQDLVNVGFHMALVRIGCHKCYHQLPQEWRHLWLRQILPCTEQNVSATLAECHGWATDKKLVTLVYLTKLCHFAPLSSGLLVNELRLCSMTFWTTRWRKPATTYAAQGFLKSRHFGTGLNKHLYRWGVIGMRE